MIGMRFQIWARPDRGPPGWDMITLCSTNGKAYVAQLARALVSVSEVLGSILIYSIFFSPFFLVRTL